MTSLTMTLGLLTILAAADDGNDDTAPTPGNPPTILVAGAIDSRGNLEVIEYKTIYIGFDGASYNMRTTRRLPLTNVSIHTVGGKELSVKEVRKLLTADETPVLVTSHGASVPSLYRQLFADDVLVFRFPRTAPKWRPIDDPTRPLE